MPGFLKLLGGLGPGRFLQAPPTGDSTPIVSRVTPNSGRLTNGVAVTISGFNFKTTSDQLPPIVFFGDNQAVNVVVVDAHTLTATAPVAALTGTVDISVRVGSQIGTLYASFTYFQSEIVSVDPASGPFGGGLSVMIIGYNFQLGSSVFFGGSPATNVIFIDSQHIRCTIPSHATGFVDVQVVGP